MLALKNITKDYKTGDTVVQALKGVSIGFRANEFVSILGPSGCGKTTLLNIIGGLDRYTTGDLCTKRYWLPNAFLADSGRPANPLMVTTDVCAWTSTISPATEVPRTS